MVLGLTAGEYLVFVSVHTISQHNVLVTKQIAWQVEQFYMSS